MLMPFPFTFPEGFWEQIGYPPATVSGRRFVAFYWQNSGDELAWEDGQRGGAGQLGHHPWLAFFQRFPVSAWLWESRIDLGSSEEWETHWLIRDCDSGRVWIAPRAAALAIVRAQQLPPAGGER